MISKDEIQDLGEDEKQLNPDIVSEIVETSS